MLDVETVTLEDHNEYVIADKINCNNKTYAYLVDTNDNKYFCIRIIEDHGEECNLLGLSSSEEFDYALDLISKKYSE